MTRIDINIDAADAHRRLDPARAARVILAWLPKAGEIGAAHIKKTGREKFKRPTGATLASVRAAIVGEEAVVGPNTPYAAWVNDGTKPHYIYPRNAKALAFANARFLGPRKVGPSTGGAVVFAKRVYHPGFAGHHYMEDAAEPTKRDATELLRSMLAQEYAP